jgi:hypothetical protein
MSIAWNGYEIAGIVRNGVEISACRNGVLLWPVAAGNDLNFTVPGASWCTGYARVTNGADSTLYGPYTAFTQISGIKQGSIVELSANLANYYRGKSLVVSTGDELSAWEQANTGNKSFTGSGIITADSEYAISAGGLNRFTAKGTFHTISNSYKGWWMPHKVAGVTSDYPTSVSATQTMQYKYMAKAAGTTWSNGTVSLNALRNVTFSSFSAHITQTASASGKEQSTQSLTNSLVCHNGINVVTQTNYSNGYNGSVATKHSGYAHSLDKTAASFTPVTAMQSNNTLGVYAYTHGTYKQGATTMTGWAQTRVDGAWTATGIAP